MTKTSCVVTLILRMSQYFCWGAMSLDRDSIAFFIHWEDPTTASNAELRKATGGVIRLLRSGGMASPDPKIFPSRSPWLRRVAWRTGAQARAAEGTGCPLLFLLQRAMGMGGASTAGLFVTTGPAGSERKLDNIFGLGLGGRFDGGVLGGSSGRLRGLAGAEDFFEGQEGFASGVAFDSAAHVAVRVGLPGGACRRFLSGL